ncbi:MAG TPA: hypothetical protein VEY06_07500 [Flavisolibacter sp.]|nr:hypothetical protein [Flavisolibacter sp.]
MFFIFKVKLQSVNGPALHGILKVSKYSVCGVSGSGKESAEQRGLIIKRGAELD